MIDVPARVKEALKKGIYLKNYVINVLTNSGTVDFSIENENLVSESVSINEKLCSDDTIKFGLCEGSQISFQYFGKQNIRGRRIQVILQVQYSEMEWYDIPMGFFDIKECSTQASTGIIKASGYNKLMSNYLDEKADDLIKNLQGDSPGNGITIQSIQSALLQGFRIEEKEEGTVIGSVGSSSSYLVNEFTFKLNGSSKIWYPYVKSQYLTFRPNQNKRCKLQFEQYLAKLKNALQALKEEIYSSVQNPDICWQNFLNSSLYQIHCNVTGIFGAASGTINAAYVLNPDKVESHGGQLETFGNLEKLKYLFGVGNIGFNFPIAFGKSSSWTQYTEFDNIWETTERINLQDMTVSELPTDDIQTIVLKINEIKDVTLRDLTTANYELHCQYGQLSRITDLFSEVTLGGGGLFPRDSLYPGVTLFPGGNSERANKAMYSQLWADKGNVRIFKNLVITYKTLDSEDKETDLVKTYVVNADGTDDYIMDDNWLFKNLIWTEAQVDNYAEKMIEAMEAIKWFPFEMWCSALPYLETGDEIEITIEDEVYTSYILQRTIDGIQRLEDTYINGQLDIF